MKHARKLASLLLALVMVFALAVTAFAQDVPVADGAGSITISNAAKGETYAIYKLFDATVSADHTSIAYTGTIPESLKPYFTADANDYISATDLAKTGENMSDGLKAALKTWAEGETKTAEATSDGSALKFNGLAYGYYVVTTTQGNQVISVDSTMPNAIIVDKNSSTPSDLKKRPLVLPLIKVSPLATRSPIPLVSRPPIIMALVRMQRKSFPIPSRIPCPISCPR